MARRSFGKIRQLPSGRYQASYVGPDDKRYLGPIAFPRKEDAEVFLAGVQSDIARDKWEDPRKRLAREREELIQHDLGAATFNEWSEIWLEGLAAKNRAPKTIQTYRYRMTLLREEFGTMAMSSITSGDVDAWYTRLNDKKGNGVARPAYMTLRSCLKDAEKQGRITKNPCTVAGASKHVPVKDPERRQVATPEEVRALAHAMPDKWAIAVWLAAWCQVREGEMIGLRRRDVDLATRTLHIRRQTQFLTGAGGEDGKVKSDAGERSLAIPQALIPIIEKHLKDHVGKDPDARLIYKPGFPAEPIHPNTFRAAWNRAREAVGMKWFVYHDLRHTGLTVYAQNGATLAELLHRGGHSDVEVALRYQHATRDRDEALSARMNEQVLS